MLIKLWDWDQKWSCTQVFEGHTHYVMEVVFNPKDNNQFASASLDRTLKVGYSHKLVQMFKIKKNILFQGPNRRRSWFSRLNEGKGDKKL